jgi:hypothetical protein
MSARLSLREQQSWFALASTDAGGSLEGGARASRLLGRSLPIEQCLTEGPNLSAAERLAIYNDGYFARLIECLADDYPALQYLVGEEQFAVLARAYIRAFPSRSPSLNVYGARMAEFCRARPEPWAPFAVELARLEWALVEVVHAPSARGFTPAALSTIPAAAWKTARLRASPTLRLLSFEYPVNAYFQAFRDGSAPARPEPRRSWTAISRRGLPVTRTELEPAAAALLEDLLSGAPLESAVNELARRSEEPARIADELPRWLADWVASGFFSAVEGSCRARFGTG